MGHYSAVLLAASSADIMTSMMCNPAEVSCVHRGPHAQVVVKHVQLHGGRVVPVVRTIHALEGWRGFFRGVFASMITSAPSSAIWWSSYELARHTLAQLLLPPPTVPGSHWADAAADGGVRSHALHAVAGAMASLVTCLVTNPLDVVKTRLQTNTNTYGHTTMLRTLACIARREGLRGLARGLGARLTIAVPSAALSTLTYEYALASSRE